MTLPPQTQGLIAAYTAAIAAMTAGPIPPSMLFKIRPVDDEYSAPMARAQVRVRRLERSINHRTGAWRGDGVAPAETRQVRRARNRKAVKR